MLSRNGIYYFRIAIPLDLRKIFGYSEIKKSLKTKKLKEAKASAAHCRYKTNKLFFGARWGMISTDQAKKIRSLIIAETIEDLHSGNEIFPHKNDDFLYLKKRIDGHKFNRGQVLDALANKHDIDKGYLSNQASFLGGTQYNMDCGQSFHSHVIERARSLIHELNLEVLVPFDINRSEEFITIDDSILYKDFIDLCTIVYKTLYNVVDVEDRKAGNPVEASYHKLQKDIIKQYKDGLPDPKLSELWDAYYQDKTTRNEWRVRTAEKYMACYKIVLDIIGDAEIDQIGSHTVQKLISGLQQYPKNKNKIQQFKDKPFSKAMAKVPGFQALDVSSVNFTIGMMSGLFNFALEDRRRWRVDNNPFFRKQIKEIQNKEAHEFRREFTHGELQGIIGEIGKIKRLVNPEKYWVPIICLYSGMRINEACQLRIEDIEYIEDIPVFQIRHNPKLNQETKNAKNRTVPIHKTLQSLGFLEYVAWQKDWKSERLFPKLTIYKGKWHKKVDAWFNRTVLRDHLKLEHEVSFHSTKHSFVNWFKQNINMNYTELAMLKTIAAHFDDKNLSNKFDDGGITTNLYGKSYNIKALYDFINMLDYKIDLSALEQKTL